MELRQLRRVVAAGIELQPAVAGDATRARHEQFGLHALRHALRREAPRREGLPVFLRAVVAQAALRVPVAGKSPVRRGVVFLHTGQDMALELFPAGQHGPLARLEGGPRELEIAVGRVPVHERAGIAGQPLRRPYPERLDSSFHKALALRAARYGIGGRDPQTGHHARAVVQQQTVDVARPAIAVEQGRDAAVTAGHAQGVQHGQGAFGQGHGDAHAAARGHVQDGRDFRLEGLAVVRVQHLRVKGGAVRRINIGGPQLRGVAALVGAQLQQGIARGPSGFALRLAHLGQQAAAGMDAGWQFAALAHGPAQLGVGQCHGGVLRFLVMEKKFGGPRGGLGCRALGRKGRLAASQIIGIPAIKCADTKSLPSVFPQGCPHLLCEQGRQFSQPEGGDDMFYGRFFAYQRQEAVKLTAKGQTGRHDDPLPVGEGAGGRLCRRSGQGRGSAAANRCANFAANRCANFCYLFRFLRFFFALSQKQGCQKVTRLRRHGGHHPQLAAAAPLARDGLPALTLGAFFDGLTTDTEHVSQILCRICFPGHHESACLDMVVRSLPEAGRIIVRRDESFGIGITGIEQVAFGHSGRPQGVEHAGAMVFAENGGGDGYPGDAEFCRHESSGTSVAA